MVGWNTETQKNGDLAVPIFLMYAGESSALWCLGHPVGSETTSAHTNSLGFSIHQRPNPL